MRPDVVILGGGLAGLSLARHLLLHTDQTVLLLERRDEIPGPRQKVGESQVQLAGYYFSKILDLEEHLLTDHFMKYNLRFYHKPPERDGAGIEDYSQSYIRNFSNVASYQVDRNRLEEEMLALNTGDPRFAVETGVGNIAVDWGEDEAPHSVSFTRNGTERTVETPWVVDATGRVRLTAKRRSLAQPNRIHHGSFFWWVEGRVDVDRLTDLTPKERRLRRDRAFLGHLPTWLATVHFLGDGFWFWVIPLQGKTSLGLVFDTEVIDPSDVFSVEKATEWVCERFLRPRPAAAQGAGLRRLPQLLPRLPPNPVGRTLGHDRRGRAVQRSALQPGKRPDRPPQHDDRRRHRGRRSGGPQLPGAHVRDPGEGDVRGLRAQLLPRLSRPGRSGDLHLEVLLGAGRLLRRLRLPLPQRPVDRPPVPRLVLPLLLGFGTAQPRHAGAYARWKEAAGDAEAPPTDPRHFDFTEIGPLARAEKTFYKVGLTVEEARQVLDEQLDNLREHARYALAHVAARVVGDPELVRHRAFVEALDPDQAAFDPPAWRELAIRCGAESEPYPWSFDPGVLDRYRRTSAADLEEVPA